MRRFKLLVTALAIAAGAGSTGCLSELGSGSKEGAIAASDGCTLTQGFWKNHEEAWPVTSLTLGSVTYDQAQLLAILGQPVQGNGVLSLGHQLIAAKLNVASGADSSAISSEIAAADAAIGSLVAPPIGSGSLSTSSVSSLVSALDDFNNGVTGPGHCDDGPGEPLCGNQQIEAGEECDDGNTSDGDGCSSVCTEEDPPPPPRCGDEQQTEGEECDDGNTSDGDGCSANCTIEDEPPPPECGNGIDEDGEQCDDGNTNDGDGCSAVCSNEEKKKAVCGDGVVLEPETCDDGNTKNDDGCSATCTTEPDPEEVKPTPPT